MPFAQVETRMGWKPQKDQYNVNVEIRVADGGPYTGLASHIVTNVSTGSLINMSGVCPIFPQPQPNFGNQKAFH